MKITTIVTIVTIAILMGHTGIVGAVCDNIREPLAETCVNRPFDCSMFYSSTDQCCDQQSECPGYIAPSPTPGPAACDNSNNLRTAIGCVPTNDPNAFVAWLLSFTVGIAGGIAFLLMLFGSFQIMASSGNPESLQAGKETFQSALAGLLMIIFSVFLLKLIGVDILGLPGLSK